MTVFKKSEFSDYHTCWLAPEKLSPGALPPEAAAPGLVLDQMAAKKNRSDVTNAISLFHTRRYVPFPWIHLEGFQIAEILGLPKMVEAEDTKNLQSRGIRHNFSDFR